MGTAGIAAFYFGFELYLENYLGEMIFSTGAHFLIFFGSLVIGVVSAVTIRRLRRWSRQTRYMTNLSNFPARTRIMHLPYGVTLVIGPWNYPYMLSLIPAISALAAGNTVILKPSEVTAHSSAALARLINSNFPRELFYVQEGGVEETTDLLKEKFDKIFFTGIKRRINDSC